MTQCSSEPAAKKRVRHSTRPVEPPLAPRFPIAVTRDLSVLWLQANYGVEEGDLTHMSSRTPEGSAGKERLQRAALLYARVSARRSRSTVDSLNNG